MEIYEYLFTAIIIFSIFIASTILVSSISQPSLTVSIKEQLQITGQKVMTQLLLDAGNPPDWGSSLDIESSNITTFGLAKYGETTRDAYELDPNKVMRLSTNHPFFIQPSVALNLLNLGTEYGFKLEFFPSISVNVEQLGTYNVAYDVNVTSDYGGLPIVGANVTAKMYYYDEGTEQIENTTQFITNTTVTGTCHIDCGVTSHNNLLALIIEYKGIRVIKIAGANVTRTILIGNNLYGAPALTNTIEIMVNKKTINGTSIYAIENLEYDIEQETIEPTTIAIIGHPTEGNDLFSASNLPVSGAEEEILTYSTIPEATLSPTLVYPLERSVVIRDSAYVMKLEMWRMSW